MTKKEFAAQNIGMTFDFIRQIIENPACLDAMSANTQLDFVETGLPLGSTSKSKLVAKYKVRRIFEPVR
jgi:hypothetical protein